MMILRMRLMVVFALLAALCAIAMAQPPQPPGGTKDQPAKKEPAIKKEEPAKKVEPAKKEELTKKEEPTKKVESVKKEEPARKVEPVKKDDSQVRAFELKSANPSEVQQALQKYFAAPVASKAGATAPAATAHVAFDARTKTVFVRGTAAEIEAAGKMIAQLDGGHIIQLKNASVEDVMKVLTSLDIAGKVQSYPKAQLIIVPQNDSHFDQIKTVVEHLDAGNKTEPKK